MSTKLDSLRDLGLISDAMSNMVLKTSAFTCELSELDFSGYGEFTPITVGSSTVFGNANLERSKQ